MENRTSCSPGEINIHYNNDLGLIVVEKIENLAMNHITWPSESEGSITVECSPDLLYISVNGSVNMRINMQEGLNLNIWAGGIQVFPFEK